jgi:hypothetical protein
MRKAAIAVTLIIALLLTVAAATFLVKLGSANPYMRDYVAPDAFTKPPEISIYSPQNNIPCSKVYLSINVSLPKSTTASFSFLHNVHYQADWLANQTYLYNSKGLSDEIRSDNSPERQYFSYSGVLDGVPEGSHSLTIYAEGGGWYPPQGIMQSGFFIDGNSTVFFTVDNTPPRITHLSVENKTYSTANATSDVALTILTNEPVAQTSYSLDGKTNMTVTGNATLAGLSVGEHFLTVYSWDSAGNIGASETVTFNISNPEPFPTVPVVAVSLTIGIIMVASAGLLVYHKKRR